MTVDAFEGLSVVKANNLLFNETILFGKLECLTRISQRLTIIWGMGRIQNLKSAAKRSVGIK